jgi:hypothetical protein
VVVVNKAVIVVKVVVMILLLITMIKRLPIIISLIILALAIKFRIENNQQSKVSEEKPIKIHTLTINPEFTVKEVIDGNTIKVVDVNNKEIVIRLACINAPKLNEVNGIESRDFLKSLLKSHNNKIFVNNGVIYLPNNEIAQLKQLEKGLVSPLISENCFSETEVNMIKKKPN